MNTETALLSSTKGMSASMANKLFKMYRKSNKATESSLDPKDFNGETSDMNNNMFQPIHESKNATHYVKTLKSLEGYAFKTYMVDLSLIFDYNHPKLPTIRIPATQEEKKQKKIQRCWTFIN